MTDLVKGMIAKEPARVIAWTSAAAVAGALKLAELLGVGPLPAEVIAGVSAIAGFAATEVIRRYVYSPATWAKRNVTPPDAMS